MLERGRKMRVNRRATRFCRIIFYSTSITRQSSICGATAMLAFANQLQYSCVRSQLKISDSEQQLCWLSNFG